MPVEVEGTGNHNRDRAKGSVTEEEGSTSAQVVVDRDKVIVVANKLDVTAGKPKGDPNGNVRGGHKWVAGAET